MKNLLEKTAFKRAALFIFSDVFFTIFSVWLAFLLRFDFNIPSQYLPFVDKMAALAVFFVIPVFYFHGLYFFTWAYVSASEAVSLIKATTISFLFLSVAIFLSHYFPYFINFPRSTIFISYILVLIFCGGFRFSKRIYFNLAGRVGFSKRERTLIIGAGDAGEQVLRSILSSTNSPYWPIGFIDDNPTKKEAVIHGLKVKGKISDIPKIVAENNIRQLIIAFPSAENKAIKEAVKLGRQAGIKKIKIAPPLSEIIDGKISFRNLKNLEVEDLLGRIPVLLESNLIKKFISGKIILVTGAAGSIGSELSRQIAKFNPGLLLLIDQDETGIFDISNELREGFSSLKIKRLVADITDRDKVGIIFKKFSPQIVFHAAAYKHVALMESNPDEAVRNNIFGTKILAEAALKSGVERFIFISTDKAINPVSVMGITKRIGEMICQTSNQKNHTKFISVRFGNVLNSRGSVIPIFKRQIEKGGPVEVTHPDMRRYFMLIPEACLLVMQAASMGSGGEVFVLDMGKPIKILDLAKDMIRLSGLEPDKDIAIVFTGTKPGEKMFEELLSAEEGTVATKNQKIFVAKLSNISSTDLEQKIKKIETALGSGDNEELKEVLRQAVSI